MCVSGLVSMVKTEKLIFFKKKKVAGGSVGCPAAAHMG